MREEGIRWMEERKIKERRIKKKEKEKEKGKRGEENKREEEKSLCGGERGKEGKGLRFSVFRRSKVFSSRIKVSLP